MNERDNVHVEVTEVILKKSIVSFFIKRNKEQRDYSSCINKELVDRQVSHFLWKNNENFNA